jgi:hypothetical protein
MGVHIGAVIFPDVDNGGRLIVHGSEHGAAFVRGLLACTRAVSITQLPCWLAAAAGCCCAAAAGGCPPAGRPLPPASARQGLRLRYMAPLAAVLLCHVVAAGARGTPLVPPSHDNHSLGVLLFFDGKHLSSATNVARQLGRPELLATFADPVSYVGWGYPSIWRDGSKTRLIYEANYNHSHTPRVQLLAESTDDVHFRLTDTTNSSSPPISQRLRPNQVLEPNVGTERGCVFDDAGANGQDGARRLKMLMSNASVLEGDSSGTRWRRRPHDW